MSDLRWVDGHIEVPAPGRPLKVSGTRFAAVRGLNRWSTPFQAWCEMTRTYKEPFVDTKYTIAGKAIEPKQADWLADEMGFGDSLVRPSDVYGDDAARAAGYDFFPEQDVFGGMWDYLIKYGDDVSCVVECKTTKRAEDWVDGPPEYYAEQAALYAHLLGCDDVMMVVTFLEEHDYTEPEKFVVTGDNTALVSFKVSERYPDFPQEVAEVERWYREHVQCGVSPDYSERADAEFLKALRTAHPDTSVGVHALLVELERAEQAAKPLNDRIKALRDAVTHEIADGMQQEGKTRAVFHGEDRMWTLAWSQCDRFDSSALKKDDPDLYQKYVKQGETLRLTSKAMKG